MQSLHATTAHCNYSQSGRQSDRLGRVQIFACQTVLKSFLIAGGAGYIGAHTCVELLNAGHDVVVFDNFCNSHAQAVRRVEQLTGKVVTLVQGDIRDEALLTQTLQRHQCHAVVHFAGLKEVDLSVASPLDFYDSNVAGTLSLLRAMQAASVKRLVFSSSAAVYGEPRSLPLNEEHVCVPTSPYGRSKLFIEHMLRDLCQSDGLWAVGVLRYFNPVGAHASGLIGDSARRPSNNVMTTLGQVALGKLPSLQVFGGDYATPDGSCVRDFIHVVDLALGHVKALERVAAPGYWRANLGTGQGHSVLELVKSFEGASARAIPFNLAPRRAGDISASYADASLAARLLGWRATRDMACMCEDQWRWQSAHPNGYGATV